MLALATVRSSDFGAPLSPNASAVQVRIWNARVGMVDNVRAELGLAPAPPADSRRMVILP